MDKKYGLYVVIVGIVAIMLMPVAVAIALGFFPNASKDTILALTGPATTAIAAIAGAYFGVNLGAAGKQEAEKGKDDANKEAADAKKKAAAARGVALAWAGVTKTPEEVKTAIEDAMA